MKNRPDDYSQKHFVAGATCPACASRIDGASGGQAAPEPGDFSVCIFCSAVLRFGEAGVMRVASADEIAQELSPRARDQVARIAHAALMARLSGVWSGPRK